MLFSGLLINLMFPQFIFFYEIFHTAFPFHNERKKILQFKNLTACTFNTAETKSVGISSSEKNKKLTLTHISAILAKCFSAAREENPIVTFPSASLSEYCPAQRAKGGITHRPLRVRRTSLAPNSREITPLGVQTVHKIIKASALQIYSHTFMHKYLFMRSCVRIREYVEYIRMIN